MIQAVFTVSPSHILSWSISISQLTSWFQLKTVGGTNASSDEANVLEKSILSVVHRGRELVLGSDYSLRNPL